MEAGFPKSVRCENKGCAVTTTRTGIRVCVFERADQTNISDTIVFFQGFFLTRRIPHCLGQEDKKQKYITPLLSLT